MLGKQKCRILKQIRQRIADENDIPYVTRECGFQGECRGTCPRCESELRYLEQQLARREALGKKVAVAALCAGMGFAAAGCAPIGHKEPPVEDLVGLMDEPPATEEPLPTEDPEIFVEMGEVAWEDPEESPCPAEVTPVPDDEFELMGDVAYFGESDG